MTCMTLVVRKPYMQQRVFVPLLQALAVQLNPYSVVHRNLDSEFALKSVAMAALIIRCNY